MSEEKRYYNPNRSPQWNYKGAKWKLSRSKIDLFIECPRCFYLDNKLGTKRPGMPAFTLNIAVDTLLKEEFDIYRKKKEVHPLLKKEGISAVPFVHEKLNEWRDNFEGVTYLHEPTQMTVSGALDDVWITPKGTLVVVDYKATSKDTPIRSLSDTSWGEQYARQLSVYAWLLEKNGFQVESTGYFVYANAHADREAFNAKLEFDISLLASEVQHNWIEQTLGQIFETLESDSLPKIGDRCEYCPYREASGKKLQAIYKQQRTQ